MLLTKELNDINVINKGTSDIERDNLMNKYYQIKNKITDTNKDKSNKSVSNVEKTIKYLNQVGLSEEKYVKKFDNICSKLSKEELQIIIKSLSLRTKSYFINIG